MIRPVATRSTIYRNLGLLSVSLLIGCLMMEAFVRVAIRVFERPPLVVAHERAGWTGRPNLRAEHVSVGGARFLVSTDSLGRRVTHESSREVASAIALAGDSFVFGLNVNDRETFPWKLAEAFLDREVINLGVPGYGTCQELVSVEDLLQPNRRRVSDLVVVVFENDFLDEQRPFDAYLGRNKPEFRVHGRVLDRGGFRLPVLDRLMDHSRLIWLVRSKLGMLRDRPAIDGNQGESVVLACLEQMRRRADQAGARVHIYAHRRTTRTSSLRDATWRDFIERSGAVDITNVFRPSNGKNPIGADGAHWNAEGHRRAAAIIRKSL